MNLLKLRHQNLKIYEKFNNNIMEKNLYIDASHPDETRVVLKENGNIEDYEYEGIKNTLIKNNIYLGKVSRIEPSLQAAFVDFGRERHGFLSFNDIQSDYYQIPTNDLEKIKEEEKKVREELAKQSEKDEIDNEKNDNDAVEKKPEEENQNGGNLKLSRAPSKRYKIQEVIKPNQVILVQVLKDERGLKGAALSTFISIAGKYIVLMPNTPKGGGISRKIFNSNERKKIRSILNEIIIPKEIMVKATPTLHITKKATRGFSPNLIRSGLAIMPSGIRYSPIPIDIAVNATFNQFSLTIPAAIKTTPQTGGVIVDSKANQKTKRCV